LKSFNTHHTELFRFNIFEEYHEVKHFVSGRNGGCSPAPFNGLNLGFGTDDAHANVLENRYMLAESLGTPLDWFVFPRQTHSATIAVVNKSHKGIGTTTRESLLYATDALITADKNVFIVVQVADCVPVLLLDTENEVVAAIHAGWRGTVQEITRKTIEAMMQQFNTKPEDIVAGIGPSIGACCYEVGKEVFDAFINLNSNNTDLFKTNANSWQLDLWKANQKQLIGMGVKTENIEIAGICSRCNHEKFFSSRHDNGNTGRFTAGIMLQ
jgi:YfiH family protein